MPDAANAGMFRLKDAANAGVFRLKDAASIGVGLDYGKRGITNKKIPAVTYKLNPVCNCWGIVRWGIVY